MDFRFLKCIIAIFLLFLFIFADSLVLVAASDLFQPLSFYLWVPAAASAAPIRGATEDVVIVDARIGVRCVFLKLDHGYSPLAFIDITIAIAIVSPLF